MEPLPGQSIEQNGRKEGGIAASRRSLSILLVDDDEVDAKYVRWLLKSVRRFRVDLVEVRSIEEARLVDAGRVFDVYLVDFWLSHETSIAFVREIADAHPRAAIMLLTSIGCEDIEELGLRAGAHGFLSKTELSENALEFGISAGLSRAEALGTMRRRIRRLEGERDELLHAVSRDRMEMLARLDDLHQHVVDELARVEPATVGPIADALAEMRRELLERTAGDPAGNEVRAAAPEARSDLRDIVDEAVEAYGYEADLRGISVVLGPSRKAVPVEVDRVSWVAALVGLLEWVAGMAPTVITVWCHAARGGVPATVRILARSVAAGDHEDGALRWPEGLVLPVGASSACERSSDGSIATVLGVPPEPDRLPSCEPAFGR